MDEDEMIVTNNKFIINDMQDIRIDFIIDDLKDFLHDNKNRIFTFVSDNKNNIKNIYETIKNGDCRRCRVNVYDLNIVMHKYNEYLDDMISYIPEFKDKYIINNEISLLDTINKMIKKDSGFFDSVAEKSNYSISEAMQNIEILTGFKDFIKNNMHKLEDNILTLDCDDEIKKGFVMLFASSLSTFITYVVNAIFSTFTEITVALESYNSPVIESTRKKSYILLNR
jgi:hypothetical protein